MELERPLRFRAQNRVDNVEHNETYYEPSFYFMRLGSSIDIEVVLDKVNNQGKPLSENEKFFLQDVFHEYIHFLQDLSFPYFRKKAWNRLAVIKGKNDVDEFSSSSDKGFIDGGVEVVQVDSDDRNVVVRMSSGTLYRLTDESIVESQAILLDDRFSDKGWRMKELPYDLPMMVARYFVKDVKPYCLDDVLREWLIDIEEAALGTACPVKAFYDFFARQPDATSLARECKKGYASICRLLKRFGYKQLSRLGRKKIVDELDKAYPGVVFQSFRKWLTNRICAVESLRATENKGLFHRIYDSILDANRRYLEFGQLIKDIGYPLISTPYITYCDVRDDDMSVMYLLSLHTAYVLATTSSPFACDSISACQSAGNVVLNTRFLTAPKVCPGCWFYPPFVTQAKGFDCAFVKIWKCCAYEKMASSRKA